MYLFMFYVLLAFVVAYAEFCRSPGLLRQDLYFGYRPTPEILEWGRSKVSSLVHMPARSHKAQSAQIKADSLP